MRLGGKVAVVTGGTRGIGRAISLTLAREGAIVAVNHVRDEVSARETVRLIEGMGGEVTAYKANVGDERQVKQMFESIRGNYGPVDILVNNAAIALRSSIFELTSDEWSETLRTNLTGCFLCTKMVLPDMVERRSGKIINVSSLGGKIGSAVGGHYAASKGGMIAFTKSVARELAPYGINVNAVVPGVTRTEMMEEVFPPEAWEEALKVVPQGRRRATGDSRSGSLLGHRCVQLHQRGAYLCNRRPVATIRGMQAHDL